MGRNGQMEGKEGKGDGGKRKEKVLTVMKISYFRSWYFADCFDISERLQ